MRRSVVRPRYFVGRNGERQPLIWSTDYSIGSDWTASDGSSTGIDGLTRGLWLKTTTDGAEEQITTAAAMPGMTRGQRHWKGDGSNNNSGGTRITLTPRWELWVRWYMRYQSGFAWTSPNYDKWIRFELPSGTGASAIPEFSWIAGNDRATFFCDGTDYDSAPSKGWNYVMGGATGDGLHHLYEAHIKVSTGGGSNGVLQLWIDEELLVDRSDVPFGSLFETDGVGRILIGDNQATPNNGADAYVDFNRIAVSESGYIGPA